jgi:hypothetical protein
MLLSFVFQLNAQVRESIYISITNDPTDFFKSGIVDLVNNFSDYTITNDNKDAKITIEVICHSKEDYLKVSYKIKDSTFIISGNKLKKDSLKLELCSKIGLYLKIPIKQYTCKDIVNQKAEWFDSKEKKVLWWNCLSDGWKDCFLRNLNTKVINIEKIGLDTITTLTIDEFDNIEDFTGICNLSSLVELTINKRIRNYDILLLFQPNQQFMIYYSNDAIDPRLKDDLMRRNKSIIGIERITNN